MQHPVQTVIAELNALFRESLTRLLDNSCFRTVASDSRLDDLALGALNSGQHTLLLIGGDDIANAVRGIRCFREHQPAGRVVVLAERPNREHAMAAFRAGANAYLAEVASWDALVKSLELVMMGVAIFPFPMMPTMLGVAREQEEESGQAIQFSYSDVPALSAREKCILGCLANGSPNKAIARKVDIAEATVKVHVKAILRKIRVQNRTQAAIWAMHHRVSFGLENGAAAPASFQAKQFGLATDPPH